VSGVAGRVPPLTVPSGTCVPVLPLAGLGAGAGPPASSAPHGSSPESLHYRSAGHPRSYSGGRGRSGVTLRYRVYRYPQAPRPTDGPAAASI